MNLKTKFDERISAIVRGGNTDIADALVYVIDTVESVTIGLRCALGREPGDDLVAAATKLVVEKDMHIKGERALAKLEQDQADAEG